MATLLDRPSGSTIIDGDQLLISQGGSDFKISASAVKTYTKNNVDIPVLTDAAALAGTDYMLIDQGTGVVKVSLATLKIFFTT